MMTNYQIEEMMDITHIVIQIQKNSEESILWKSKINQEVDKLRKKLKEISKKMEKMVRMMTEQAECSADFHDIKTIIEREKKRTQRKKKMYDRYVTVKPHGEVTMSR